MADQPEVAMKQVARALQGASTVVAMQGERLMALEEQRNALVEALQRTNTTLNKAQQNTQEANQCTREIIDLIGQQWATLMPSHSESSGGSSAKIDVTLGPGRDVKQPIKQVNCLRLSTRQHKPLTKGWVEWVHFRGETPRESDWGCQSIPWLLYTIIRYVCTCLYQIYRYYLGQA